jgi:uncharacterized membrane protein YbhN (UPF0104 family)
LRASLPEWMDVLKAIVLPKRHGLRTRMKGLGIVAGIAIAVAAVFALTHALKNIDYGAVLEAVHHANAGHIALALVLVIISYGSLTLYDVLALRTIGRTDVPYRIAALASFTSYSIAHGVGVVSLVSPVVRYRIYSYTGLGVVDVANICFLSGLAFWLGNLTALALSLLGEPGAISPIDYVAPPVTRLLAEALLLAPFVIALGLLGVVEAMRGFRART